MYGDHVKVVKRPSSASVGEEILVFYFITAINHKACDILHHVYPKNNDEAGPIFRLRSYVTAIQGVGQSLLSPTSIRERDENLSRALELNTLLNKAHPPSISQPPPDSPGESFVVLLEQSS